MGASSMGRSRRCTSALLAMALVVAGCEHDALQVTLPNADLAAPGDMDEGLNPIDPLPLDLGVPSDADPPGPSCTVPDGGLFVAGPTLSAGRGLSSLAAGDLDGDGRVDLVVTNYLDSGTVTVLLQPGAGRFAPPVAYPVGAFTYPCAVALGDLDGDGRPEVVVGNYTSRTVSVLRNLGQGRLDGAREFPVGLNCQSVAVADLDGDARLDVVASTGDGVYPLLNRGGGALAAGPAVALNGGAAAVTDFDGDGRPDVAAVEQWPGRIALLRNRAGALSISSRIDAVWPSTVAAADLDGDRRPDLFDLSDSLGVYRGAGDGTFRPRTRYPLPRPDSLSVVTADFDEDGRLDVVVASFANSLFLNQGGGVLGPRLELPGHTWMDFSSGAPAAVPGDFDFDGDLDLAIIESQSVQLLLNRCR